MAWGGMCGREGMHGRGACIAGGCAWQGGMCGRYYEIWSISGQYVSYWNAFLLLSCHDYHYSNTNYLLSGINDNN